MVVICEECGKIYHLDPTKLKNHINKPEGIKIKCKVCEHIISIRSPIEEPLAATGTGPVQSVSFSDAPSEPRPEPSLSEAVAPEPAVEAPPVAQEEPMGSASTETTAPKMARKKKASTKGFGL